MIDLSHLTEEEQGAIMAVLRRDAELKRAEEERIRKLEKVLNSESENTLKFLSGEWFYEAKSRRHTDKIHGSEIILASIKQRSRGGSERSDKSLTGLSQDAAPDLVPPPKPARSLEALQQEQGDVTEATPVVSSDPDPLCPDSDAELQTLNSPLHSPRSLRHNPFDRTPTLQVEQAEPHNNHQYQGSRSPDLDSSHTAPVSRGKNDNGSSQTSPGSSIISESSSLGFKPVPRKRTFVSRQSSFGSETKESQVKPAEILPAAAVGQGLQRTSGSSGSSNQSCPSRKEGETQKSKVLLYDQRAEQKSAPEEVSYQPEGDLPQQSSISSMDREKSPISAPKERSLFAPVDDEVPEKKEKEKPFSEAGEAPKKMGEELTFREDGKDPQKKENDQTLDVKSEASEKKETDQTSKKDDSGLQSKHTDGTLTLLKDLSLTQGIVDPDPPISYDLNFIDTSEQQTEPSHSFRLSTQATSPTSDEESIAKVLDWFSRSIDSLDALDHEEEVVKSTKMSEKQEDVETQRDEKMKKAESTLKDRKNEMIPNRNIPEFTSSERSASEEGTEELKKDSTRGRRTSDKTYVVEEEVSVEEGKKESFSRRYSHEFSSSDRAGTEEPREEPNKNMGEDDDEKQTANLPDLKSYLEKTNMGGTDPVTKLNLLKEEGQNNVHVTAETPEINKDETSTFGNKTNFFVNESDHVDVPLNKCSSGTNKSSVSSVDGSVLQSSNPIAERRGSDTEVLSVSKPGPDSKGPSPVISTETSLCEPQNESEISPQDLTQVDISPSEISYGPNVDFNHGGHMSSKPLHHNASIENLLKREEDRKLVPSTPRERKKESSGSRRGSSRGSSRQSSPPPESTAEKIKQLKSFWEQEKKQGTSYQPKGPAESRNLKKSGKRFTKSEYDLRLVGQNVDGDERDEERRQRGPENQNSEKKSPIVSSNRTQFHTLLEFWDEASSHTRKSRLDKIQEPVDLHHLSQDLETGQPDMYPLSSTVDKRSPVTGRTPQSLKKKSKLPQLHPGTKLTAKPDVKSMLATYTSAGTEKSSKDSSRDEKSMHSTSSSGKSSRSPKRKENISRIPSHGGTFRRATSMSTLSPPEQKHQETLMMDRNPIQLQSGKTKDICRSSTRRRLSDTAETPAPRARAFIPMDYSHYLGMTENSSHPTFTASLPQEDEDTQKTSRCEFALSGPLKASTPVTSEDRHSRRVNKPNHPPVRPDYSSSDTGHDSSLSSASENWSRSKNNSNTENDDDGQNPVRKALKRAEARPKTLTKSIDDITTGGDKEQGTQAEVRHISEDPDHMKKMSQSVPSFLQQEAVEDLCVPYQDDNHGGRLTMGSSMTNISSLASTSLLSGSVWTVDAPDFGNVEVQGSINFSINYVQRLREFHVFVAECHDLAAVDPKKRRSDPYVKTYLLPDKANLGKRKTSVKKKTLNPKFNEILRYRVRLEELRTQTLLLSVWHNDTFGRNSFLGEVDVDLSTWDFNHNQMNNMILRARTTPTSAAGTTQIGPAEMKLAVRFLPQISHSEGVAKNGSNTGELHIWVKECQNLPLVRTSIDPYVKCFVLPDTSRKSRQKTRVLKRTVDPVFNHTMVYDGISGSDLNEACVELTVWDRDGLNSSPLGGLRLGVGTGKSYGAVVDWMDSTPYEVALWERMMASPDHWVEGVLPLRNLHSGKTALK